MAVILTLQVVETGEVTFQEYDPLFVAVAFMVDQVEPPSRLSSIFTEDPALEDVQVIAFVSPTYHVCPPFGDVTVRV